VEVKEQYHVKISNMFAALETLHHDDDDDDDDYNDSDDDADISRAWEIIRIQNLSHRESMLYELK
jgi:hypothetical protein